MRARYPDLLLVAAFTVVAAAVLLTSFGGGMTRVVLGLPLALLLPGYALTAALFPDAGPGLPERLTLTLGSSLASLAIVGLALNWTAWGLTPATWTVALATVTLAAVLVAIARRRRRLTEPVGFFLGNLSDRQWATFGLAALALVTALIIGRAGALEPRGAGFTQLWMLPAAQVGANDVQIGITSQERFPVAYRLELESGSQTVRTWSIIELDPGETWQTTVAVTPIRPGARTAAVLFRLDLPQVAYRQVALAGTK